jgi:hypothetical protein
MNHIDPARVRLEPSNLDMDRRHNRQQFEQALQRDWVHDHQGGGAGGGSDQDPRGGAQTAAQHALVALTHSLAHIEEPTGSEPTVSALMTDISQAARAGYRMPGDRWRLTVRVREEVLSRTEIELDAQGPSLSVALRTSSEESLAQIGAALPQLNQSLARFALVNGSVEVFLVSKKELP